MALTRPIHTGLLVLVLILLAVTTAMSAPRGPTSVTIINLSAMVLEELTIADPQNGGAIVARAEAPLSSGKSLVVKIEGASGCRLVVTGRYDDESTVAPATLDLCRRRILRLKQ